MSRWLPSLLISVVALLLGGLLGYTFRPATPSLSSYVGQQASSIRGLSAQEVDDLENGRGAGYARTAELNRYPGPRHLLDLADALALSDHQITTLRDIMSTMEGEARTVGADILATESRFSTAFATGAITETMLADQTSTLANLYGQLRAVHLRAHLESRTLLTDTQVIRYDELRGYTAPVSNEGSPLHHSMH